MDMGSVPLPEGCLDLLEIRVLFLLNFKRSEIASLLQYEVTLKLNYSILLFSAVVLHKSENNGARSTDNKCTELPASLALRRNFPLAALPNSIL